MWPGESSYATTGFFGSFCNTMSSCLSMLCCCWLFRDCMGRQRGPTTPLIAPPPVPVDGRFEQLRGPHSPFGAPGPTGPMHDRLGHLGGPHSPFGSGPFDDRFDHRGGHHSPFGPAGHHRLAGPPHSHGPPGPPEPPRVPGVQPGLL